MKRVVFFLLLFGAGLSVLIWVISRDAPEVERQAPDPPPVPEHFTNIPVASGDPKRPQENLGIVLSGKTEFTVRTEDDPSVQRPLYTVKAEDVVHLGGEVYDAKQLVVTVFDPAKRSVRFELTSPLTRLHIPVVEGQWSIGSGEQVEFSSAVLHLNEGVPIVPLTLTVPRLVWHLTEERLVDRFESSDRVQVDGEGFHAEGTGFDLTSAVEELVLRRDGLLRLRLENGGEAILRATGTGPIRVKRTIESGTGEEVLDMLTTEGARFEVRGDEPLTLEARTLHLFGRGGTETVKDFHLVRVEALENVSATSRGDTFESQHAELTFGAENQLSEAVLDGSVTLRSSGDEFRGDEARFTFDATGRMRRTLITGHPNGRIQVGKYMPEEPAPGEIERKLRQADAEISGAGPLVVYFEDETRLELEGPAKLAIAALDFEIEAEKRLDGRVRPNRQGGSLLAQGGVRMRYQTNELRSDELDLRYELPAPGKEAVTATAKGRTTLTGTPPGRERVTLVAEDGLEARTAEGRLSLPIARRVTLKAEGAEGFDARADRLLDLDWSTRHFVAEGAVTFSSAQGDGNAERVVARGTENIELHGSSADPARWAFTRQAGPKGPFDAEARALSITAKRDELHASGEVVAELRAGDERYRLESDAVDLVLDPPAVIPVDPATPVDRVYHARATGNVRARFTGPEREAEIECQRLTVDGDARGATDRPRDATLGDSDLVAEGDVKVEARQKGGLSGSGDRLTLDRKRHGRLEAHDGRRIVARGTLGAEGQPYAMTASWVEFDEQYVEAADVVVGVDPAAGVLPTGKPTVLEFVTKHFRADEKEILLEGDAHARGSTGQNDPWSVKAGTIRLTGRFTRDPALGPNQVDWIEATGGFDAVLADRARATGTTMRGSTERTRLEGSPARLELRQGDSEGNRPGGAVLESAWIQYDAENLLLSTDKGTMTPILDPDADPWSVTYESLQPFVRGESTILVLRDPRFVQGETQVRALWAVFWVDRDEWRKRGERVMREKAEGSELRVTVPEVEKAPEPPKRKSDKNLMDRFTELRQAPIAQVLSELYMEGNMEFTEAGERVARAASLYLDLKEGRGWARDADVIQDIEIGSKVQRFRAKAQWLSIGPDLSMRADKAVLTSCEYDDPHYVIETSDLRMRPPSKRGRKDVYVSASDNALRFGGTWAMPLPPLLAGKDENGYPFIGDLNFGNSARFGTALRGSFNLPLGGVGRSIGGLFDKFLDLPSIDVPEGRWKLDAGYLGSRGVLLGTGFEYVVREENDAEGRRGRKLFHFDSTIDVIPDEQDDRGLIRVDPDDRSLLRTWFRSRSRWSPTEQRWWDLALSIQSDPGVQSEFFERDFLRYEQKDNFLHYRSSWDDWYLHGTVKVLLEDRTDVEELPTVGIARGRTPIGHLGELPLYYTSQTTAAYLRRREGDSTYYAPFSDGLGDREVLRADTQHRVELPFELGFGAIHATPWVEGRFTAWNEGVDEADSPARAAAFAGIDFGTTFWRRFGNGSIHALAPTLSLHGDIVVEETDGMPVRFDHVEDPIEGRAADLTLRSRWWKPRSKERFDLEVSGTYADDLAAGFEEGFQPVSVLTEFLTFAGGVPIGFTHDGRYDLRDGLTAYSRTFVGFEPVHDLGLEFGYHLGRDIDDTLLYEAFSAGARYRATAKWELEYEVAYSFFDSEELGNAFLLRRIGHDFVMETEIGYRAGEGASFNINLKPLFAWKRSGLGLIDRWLGVYH